MQYNKKKQEEKKTQRGQRMNIDRLIDGVIWFAWTLMVFAIGVIGYDFGSKGDYMILPLALIVIPGLFAIPFIMGREANKE